METLTNPVDSGNDVERAPVALPKTKGKAPEQTFEESRYLRHLVESQTAVSIKLSNNEEVAGRVEFYDTSFIRLTRDGEPNLFLFKHDIKYLYEEE